jgi:hypothetical protein
LSLTPSKDITPYSSRLGLAGKRLKSAILKQTQNWFKKKEEITDWLDSHRNEIESGELVVFFQDECHLLWGDLCGYVWGKTSERIEVSILNERGRQTDYLLWGGQPPYPGMPELNL